MSSSPPTLPRDLIPVVKRLRDDRGYTVDELPAEYRDWNLRWDSTGAGFLGELFFARESNLGGENPFSIRATRAATLLLGQGVPEHIRRHITAVRDCFTAGLFDAVVIFCRSLIEVGAFEFVRRRGIVPRRVPVTAVEDLTLRRLLGYLARHVPSKELSRIHALVTRANRLLHSKQAEPMIDEDDAFDALRITFDLMESLFE